MRKRAYEIVYGVLEEQGHSDVIFHRITDGMKTLTVQEKRFLKRLSYGAIEWAVESDAYIRHFSSLSVRRLEPSVRTVLRMALYEILHMDTVPEAVSCHEAVELLKSVAGERYAGFVNGVLRSVLRQRDEVRLRPWEELALPKNLYEYFLDRYGKKTTKKLANAFLERQPEVTIHIDSNKISVREYEEHLQSCNLQYASGHYMRDSFLIRHCEDVRSLSGYEEGWFFVQDESSMLAVLCADIQSGDTVVDVCASPGGKSMHALLRMNGQGFLSYRDISEKKLSRVRENLRRLQYTNAKGKVWDGTRADREWRERADVVLADVPCSGMGIIGKKPEIKYHALQKVEKLVPLQREICQASLTMLRKGGVFLYSTCTICEKENEENVMWLEEHCGLKRESLDAFLPEELQNKMTAQGMIQMLPAINKIDGFFVARFRKV